MPKFIFIAGGVMSGVGKGVATASIGKILQSKGYKVTAIKIDPYINVDAGTMNPIEHGEIFVTDDGTECDQDIGNYERFLDINLTTNNYITTGRVYQTVINRERNLEYAGKCVEVVPDIPNEVIWRIKKTAKITKIDFVLIEIGGTVGEYQNLLFLEAARMMKLKHPKDVLFVLVSYLPIPRMIGEMKTKPTQTAVRLLNEAGIQPDIILARAKLPLDEPRKRKISIFCNVQKEDVISAPDVKSIYEIPINFEKENLGSKILKKFDLPIKKRNLKDWEKLVKIIKNAKKSVKIGLVGKYFQTGQFTLMDSYISIIEAIKHATWFFKRKPEIFWLSAEKYEQNPKLVKELKNYEGIIVPGGFGSRGVEGKIKAIEFCRKNKIPFLGLCLGMQLAIVEFARNVCGLKEANSTEFNSDSKYPVIDVMPEQKALLKEKKYGGTMRLGAYTCKIKPDTLSARAYRALTISERHRHRYELNNEFREVLERKGMVMAGINPEKDLVEIIELKNHPFFVATQFHPEYKSRPLKPHPLFREFIKAAIKNNSISH
ncbi:MAG: CTP synthase [Patescibacteria group bacterium]|nr:CTP synthase [Patescibacteria group bacterium]